MYFCSELLPTSALDLISHLTQFRLYLVTVIPLNFDHAILRGPSGAAQFLQLLCKCRQSLAVDGYTGNHGDRLPSTMLAIARDTYNAIALLCRSRLRRFIAM